MYLGKKTKQNKTNKTKTKNKQTNKQTNKQPLTNHKTEMQFYPILLLNYFTVQIPNESFRKFRYMNAGDGVCVEGGVCGM